MITWLFTQVWLWSLAAFALGALITWLLFVRPLQRRLTEALNSYPDYGYDYDEPNGYAGDAPLDLLRPDPEGWEPDQPETGDWDQRPRAWVAPERMQAAQPGQAGQDDSEWFREWDQRVNAIGTDEQDTAVRAVQSRGSAAVDSQQASAESSGAEAKEPADQQTEFTAALWPDAEPGTTESSETSPEELVAEIAAAAAAESGSRDDADDATESQVSGQLRSLFEAEPRDGGAAETPYVPPVGAEATQVIPKFDEGAAEPLPRRTPGAGPRPGREGGSGPMIKGHSASRQYHSPDSPVYDKIVADVWFRTASDAEIAGFEPWNGKRAT